MNSKNFTRQQQSRKKKMLAYKRVSKYSGRKPKGSVRKDKSKVGKTKKVVRKVVGIGFIVMFFAVVLVGLVAMRQIALATKDVPTEEAIKAKYSNQWTNSKLYDRNGKLLYEARDKDLTREYVNYEEIPPMVKWMVLAAEDKGFYEHDGFDYLALGKAIACYGYKYVTKQSTNDCPGGSTLTQQIMKNWFFTSDKSAKRKIREAIATLRTEQSFSKEELLEAYLNVTQYGGTIVGIKTGAKAYFDKNLDELTLAEAAILAGVPQQPGRYSVPFSADPEATTKLIDARKNTYVLVEFEQLLDKVNAEIEDEEKKITKEDIAAAKEEIVAYKRGDVKDTKAPHFVKYVLNVLELEPFEFSLAEINGGGYKIYTSLDLDIQEIAEEEVKLGVEKNVKAGQGLYNASLVTVNPKNGEILAYVGSKDFYGEKEMCSIQEGVERCKFDPQVDAARAQNAAGSSLKPMVALAGIDDGTLYSSSFLPDIPIEIGNYKPKNFEGNFMGLMKLRYALLWSRNIPFIQAIEITGVQKTLDKMEQLGYRVPGSRSDYGPAVALGAIDIRLLDHTYAYAVLANNGAKVNRNSILKIEDKDGKVIYEAQPSEKQQIVDEKAAYVVNHILGDRNYMNFNYKLKFINDGYWGGKTGTSDEHKDTWFMGYSPEVVTGVWSGNNDNSDGTIKATGIGTAMTMWNAYMKRIESRFPKTQLARPAGIVNKTVCKDSGLLATDTTPCEKESEVFIQDKLPKIDDSHKVFTVCTDQPDRLARDIDKQLGFATEKSMTYLKMGIPDLQKYLDTYLSTNGVFPTENCTNPRNPEGNPELPWVVVTSPTSGEKIISNSLVLKANGYSSANVVRMDAYIGATLLESTETSSIDKTVTLDNSYADGVYAVKFIVYDSNNKKSEKSVNITLDRITDNKSTIEITKPNNGAQINSVFTVTTKVTSFPELISKIEIYVSSKSNGINNKFVGEAKLMPNGDYDYVWNNYPGDYPPGNYEIFSVAKLKDNTIISKSVNVVFK